jgi:hypothetical protein
MSDFFDPTPEQRHELEQIADGILAVQQTFVKNHQLLTMPDRGAHQQQLAGSKVFLTINDSLPTALDGLGVFTQTDRSAPQVGIGRVSTGLGCPHAETDPDFLGLMVAFQTRSGRRIDFITINDPGSPTDTPEEFLALLKATADAAGESGLLASQTKLLTSLTRHAGFRAPAIATQVIRQTHRTVRSTSAYQQYWTGIVRARDVLGKFTFVPVSHVPMNFDSKREPTHLTKDWRARQTAGALEFELRWIPFVNERETPLEDLTREWAHDHEVPVGMIVFPKTDPNTTQARLTALLASELGANPGNWEEAPGAIPSALPATRFTAARHLAYRASQQARHALPEDSCASFFENGEISADLAHELIRRYHEKQAAGHWVPDVGRLSLV